MRRSHYPLLFSALFFRPLRWPATTTAPAAAAISTNDHGDAVLKAMLAELKRSQEKLQLGQLQRPYYIDYQVTRNSGQHCRRHAGRTPH